MKINTMRFIDTRKGTLSCRRLLNGCIRRRIVAVHCYLPPSSVLGASELELLGRYSKVVPDSPQTGLTKSEAATVSCGVLLGIAGSERLGFKPFEVGARSISLKLCCAHPSFSLPEFFAFPAECNACSTKL
jgi:hypothetical protein